MKPVGIISPVALCVLLAAPALARPGAEAQRGRGQQGQPGSRSRNNNVRAKRTRHHADRDSKTGGNRGSNPTRLDGRKSGNNRTKPHGRRSGSSKSDRNTPGDNRNGGASSPRRPPIGRHRRNNMGEANDAPSGRTIARTTGNPSNATGRNAAATRAIAFQRAANVATSVLLTLSGCTEWRSWEDIPASRDGYYLYNRRYPGDRIAITVYLN